MSHNVTSETNAEPREWSHLTEEEIAILAEHGPDPEYAELGAHLVTCGRCADEYAEAVRSEFAHHAGPPPRLDADSRKWGKEPTSPRSYAKRGSSLVGVTRRVPRVFGSRTVQLSTLAMASVVALLWLGPQSFVDTSQSPESPAVLAAIRESSAISLVLPGGEDAAADQVGTYRSGGSAGSEVTRELSALVEHYEATPSEELGVRILGGHLANGRLESARVWEETLRARFGASRDLVLLSAVISFQSNDLQGAERILRRHVQVHPGDRRALLNYGLVLARLGRSEEARAYLGLARAEGQNSQIGKRANAELARLDQP